MYDLYEQIHRSFPDMMMTTLQPVKGDDCFVSQPKTIKIRTTALEENWNHRIPTGRGDHTKRPPSYSP